MSEVDAATITAEVRRFRPYKELASGSDWLGAFPSHWSMSKVKYIASYLNGHAFKPDDWAHDGLPIVRIQNLTDPDAAINRFSGAIDSRYLITAGDVLISWSASLGVHVWDSSEDAWLNQHIFKATPDSGLVDRDFFVWLARWFIGEMAKDSHGSTMKHLTKDAFGSFEVSLPSRDEQWAIAEFLDRETGKIDALVAKKERLIELLQEKRTALITHAVTKGLDPTAPSKPSGIDWLGDIPAHWRPMKVGRLFRQTKRQGYPDLTVLSVYRDYGVIEKASRDDNINKTPDDLTSYQLVEIDDLVINKMKAWQGSLGVAQHRGITSPDYIVYMPTHAENPRFLHHVLRDKLMADVYRSISNGIRPAQWRLEPDRFVDLTVFLPTIQEQNEICSVLDSADDDLAELIERCNTGIQLVSEFRTALISAAVTGKIDVRKEAA